MWYKNEGMNKHMANYFLWGGLAVFVAFPPIVVLWGLTFAGLLMVIGYVLLLLGK